MKNGHTYQFSLKSTGAKHFEPNCISKHLNLDRNLNINYNYVYENVHFEYCEKE